MKPIFFASGPSRKFDDWDASMFENNPILGRTHIYDDVKKILKSNLDDIRKILSVPDDFSLFFVPGSGSGAIFCAFLNLLDPSRKVYSYKSGFFSEEWAKDLRDQFRLDVVEIDFEDAPKLATHAEFDKMVVMVDTTNGKRHPNYDFLPDSQKVDGIAILDAVCAAFIEEIPWKKFDAVAFSIQKVIGGDGSIGILALSPKAVKRLTIPKSWPIGRLFNINRWTLAEVCAGRTMSTPSILGMIELREILDWIKKIGGFAGLSKRVDKNWEIVNEFMRKNPEFDFLEKDAANRGRGVVCLELAKWNENGHSTKEKTEMVNKIASLATKENVFDIANFANPSWRFWVGPSQSDEDIEIGLNRFANLF